MTGDIHGTREELVALLGQQHAEIVRLRAELVEINTVASIAPSDERFGSLAARMDKVWRLSRGNEKSDTSGNEHG